MSIEKEFLANESGADYHKVTSNSEIKKEDILNSESIVLKEWKIPKCNIEDYKPVVFFYKDGNINLDFFSEAKYDYLSEYPDLEIVITDPFLGDLPHEPDEYKKLGFGVHFE